LIATEYAQVGSVLRKEYDQLSAQMEMMLSSCLPIWCINSLIKRIAEDDGNGRQLLDLMGYGGVGCAIFGRPFLLFYLACDEKDASSKV
jgi:hypothetical protein